MSEGMLAAIRQTIAILDSVDYSRYSREKAKTYLEYAAGAWKDERILVAPIVFPKFLEQALGFRLGETAGAQEMAPGGRDIPDYIPVDTRTHPFVFDCKGMDTEDLSKWRGQIERYLRVQRLRFGILTNMRDLDVYTLESKGEVQEFNFSFSQLYRDYAEDPDKSLNRENTSRFLRFVERFRYVALSKSEKLERVGKAKPWTGQETLNIELLTRRLRYIVACIHEDAASKRGLAASLLEADPDRAKAIAQEVELIATLSTTI
jgi:hypothetical protein